MTLVMMKLFPVRTFCPGIKSITSRVSSIAWMFSFKQKTVCDKGHGTSSHKNELGIVNKNVNRACSIQFVRNSGSFLGVPINRVVVCGHRVGELTQCPIRLFSAVSSEGESDMTWEELVDYSRLSPQERNTHERHKKAEKQSFYADPMTGYQVMTRYGHLKRGDCCGNACRHCPYQHKRVAEEDKKMIFNSAFFVRSGEFQDT
ncbi:uncharacterized protein C1orf53-like isoform X2 [Mizuhopecten yessoensis]|uniref:uncharacterized protein C1orf53-like isoform X2 n=1 Tax=Mizuhopecten yessoensis TaxID=6573 RepID=UPI000B45DB4A|nr:uncharacterized protein C1orf53-like isoform X2 [Mizuhopecten yessoensis]